MMKVKHYEGGIYQVLGEAKHTEAKHTEENYELVVYIDKDGFLLATPAKLFWGKVEVNGELKDRFSKID